MHVACESVDDLPLTGHCGGAEIGQYQLVLSDAVNWGLPASAPNPNDPASWHCAWQQEPSASVPDMSSAEAQICCIHHQ
jgi:hypothetical protein